MIPPLVLELRDRLDEGRQRTRRSHESGTPGRQISNQLTDLYDDVVLTFWSESIRGLSESQKSRVSELTLVAHGGFGRRDIAPYSDVDLMLLSTRGAEPVAEHISGELTRNLNDVKLDAGFSLRGYQEAAEMAWNDPVIYSSLTESRLLVGSIASFQSFFERFRRGSIRRRRKIIPAVVAARRSDRGKWGESNYLLQPNIKRSRGGLRDVQLIRWIGFACWGETQLDRLVQLGLLPQEDFHSIRRTYDFMLRLRHELHFRHGRAVDVLDRGAQMAIAEAWGYKDEEGVLAVEHLMKDYFAGAREVRNAAAYCVDEATPQPWFSRAIEAVFSRYIHPDVRMGRHHIWVRPSAINRFAESTTEALRLMAMSNRYDRRIEHRTWRSIRLAARSRTFGAPSESAIKEFIELLSHTSRLAILLRRMHDLRLIEHLIPEFKRLRGMLQFNAYHKYTVDSHSIRAVEEATKMEADSDGPGRRYRRIQDKWLLHLTLLIHDIGKGYTEDHCDVGARIAAAVADRFKFSEADRDLMIWLVQNHLIVNVFAFRHDLTDPKIVLDFAKEVGSIRRLEWLVVHTVADLRSVGPDVATDWKLGLIEDLYRRTRRYFDSGNLPGSPDDPEIENSRNAVRAWMDEHVPVPGQLNRIDQPDEVSVPHPMKAMGIDGETKSDKSKNAPNQPIEIDERIASADPVAASSDPRPMIDMLPLSLLSRITPDRLAQTLVDATSLPESQITFCSGALDPSTETVHYIILRRESARAIGSFARVAESFVSMGLAIRRAQVARFGPFTWSDFWCDHDDAAPSQLDATIEKTCRKLTELLENPAQPTGEPKQRWDSHRRTEDVNVLPRKVIFDNDTLDSESIVSLFAYDNPGLLARVTRTMADEGLVLSFAKIDTHLDQVADVFYVSESDRSKIVSSERKIYIQEKILSVIDG